MNVNWANNYDDTNFAQTVGDTRVYNMFVRAWNERLSTLSTYQPAFQDCSQTSLPVLISRAGGYMVPATLFPEARDGDVANSMNANFSGSTYTFESKAKFVSLNGLNLVFSDLNTQRLIPGLVVKVTDYYGKIVSVNMTTKTVVLDRPFDNQKQPVIGDVIYFRGKLFDSSVNPQGWWALITDVLDKVGFFVKNREANGTVSNPNRFFEDKPSITNWGEIPNYFDPLMAPPNWSGNLVSYGPPSVFTRLIRKFWREIQLVDNYTFDIDGIKVKDDRGAYIFKCRLTDNHVIVGPTIMKDEKGWGEHKPTLGMKARLVASDFKDNPAFAYYVFGNTFKFDGTAWVESEKEKPDLLEASGMPEQGDIFGPWILNTLKQIIDDLAWTYILPIGFLYNSSSVILAFFTPPLTALLALKNAPEGATVLEVIPGGGPDQSFGELHVNDRVNIRSQGNWITAINGNRITLANPMLVEIFGDNKILGSGNFIGSYGNYATADLDEPDETRWKRNLKIKNLDSVLRIGMRVYAGEQFLGVLINFTTTTILLDNFSRKPITEKLIFTETVIPLMTITLPGYDPAINWMMNYNNNAFHFYYNPQLIIPIVGEFDPSCGTLYAHDRVHAANPAGIWGTYPIVSGLQNGIYAFGPGPASKKFAREYDYYAAINNINNDLTVGRFQTEVDQFPATYTLTPTKIPRYNFIYKGTDRVTSAIKLINEEGTGNLIKLPPVDQPYVAFSQNLAPFDGMIVCRWDVPGGFTYTKERNVNE